MSECEGNRRRWLIGVVLAMSSMQPQAENAAARPGGVDAEGSPATFDCIVEPSETVQVGSSSAGIIRSVLVDRSDTVAAGALIAELDGDVEKLAADLARARANQTAELRLRQTATAFGQREQQRYRDLYDRKVASSHDMDKFETDAKVAALEQQRAADAQVLANLEAQRAEAVLQRRKVYSPIAGIVMDRFKSAGEYVDDEPLLRIAKVDPLTVEVIVPVSLIDRIQPGMQTEVILEPARLGKYPAVVARVDRVADAASATFGVRLRLDNPDNKIPAGLRCRVAFNADPAPGTPSGALTESDPARSDSSSSQSAAGTDSSIHGG
jgi:RND family efflux transporter MFP subunit